MQRKILALSGRGSTGKSITIRLAYDLLCEEPGVTVEWHEPIGRLLDFIAVVRVGKHKVGFANRGDLEVWLEEYLARLKAESCIVIVCATRSRGGTVEAVTALQPAYSVEFLYQQASRDSERNRVNRAMAKQIVHQVKHALGA
jgi:hypothetical protein